MPVKEIAQIGAAIGREFSYELIAAVAPMPQTQLDDSLVRLSESGLAFRRGTPPDAVYTFKHALVQDAAYDSLLKSRRQELHAKIARVIEHRFATVKVTEPEVLAHHFAEAGLADAAIPLWQSAGELASKRWVLNEAISHLNRALELVSALARSSQRDARELELRRRLGPAWMTPKGWAAPEVWTSLHPALALANSLEDRDARVHILGGLSTNVINQGRIAESLPAAQEALDLATATGDPDLLILGHAFVGNSRFFMGEFTEALEHANNVVAFYDAEKHRDRADNFYHDGGRHLGHPTIWPGIIRSISTWILGYPDRGLRLNDENDAYARRRGQPFDLGWVLTIGVRDFDHSFAHEDLHKRAEECERLGRENSLPVPVGVFCTLDARSGTDPGGQSRRSNCPAQGRHLVLGSERWQEALTDPQSAFLAEGMALTGDLDNAVQLIDEIIAKL